MLITFSNRPYIKTTEQVLDSMQKILNDTDKTSSEEFKNWLTNDDWIEHLDNVYVSMILLRRSLMISDVLIALGIKGIEVPESRFFSTYFMRFNEVYINKGDKLKEASFQECTIEHLYLTTEDSIKYFNKHYFVDCEVHNVHVPKKYVTTLNTTNGLHKVDNIIYE